MQIDNIRPARLRQMCESAGVDLTEFLARNKSRTLERNEATSVYVMSCDKWVKIGVASDVDRRRTHIQSNCPIPISVELEVRFHSRLYAIIAEAETHKALSDFRIHNEWFTVGISKAKRVTNTVCAATKALIRGHEKEAVANDNKIQAVLLEKANCTRGVQAFGGAS